MEKLELDDAARARGEELVLDELFDLRLYERLRSVSRGGLAEMLDRLVAVEAKHYAFWQEFFSMKRSQLDGGRRLKLAIVTLVCRVVGPSAVLLVLEGIEIYGIRKYLTLWDTYRTTPFGQALKDTLMDEFEHEDEIVSGFSGRKINPERVRAIFLGFNDGLVEILGAVSGFFAVLREPRLVLGASVAVAVAGALSMAAGSFAATSSEREIERIQRGKALFLGRKKNDEEASSPVSAGVVVGVSYFIGASLPVLPVLFGAGNALVSVVAGGVAAVVVSSVLAFLSGMDVRRRIALNLTVIALAVGVTSLIGAFVHKLWGRVLVTESDLIDDFVRSAADIRRELAQAIVGQERVIDELLIGLFARGHCLLVGVPGLAKTLLVSSLAQILDLKFQRIQFTPDLMPSDITGTDLLQENPATRQRTFEFAPGPIFANLILADEINRTPPKTQAALLQAMQERHVSVFGRSYSLPDPFFVMATQNPIEHEGTYPLPEAQLDRFLFQINMDYPSEQEEREILQQTTGPLRGKLSPVLSGEKIAAFQELVRRVPVTPSVLEKALRLVRRTRPLPPDSNGGARDSLAWGAGPRAGQALLLGAKVRCLMKGRFTVSWEDVAALAAPVLRHRLILSFRGEADGVKTDDLIRRMIDEVHY